MQTLTGPCLALSASQDASGTSCPSALSPLCNFGITLISNSPVYNTPVVANGVVYIGLGYGNVYAFNAVTGAIIWIYKATDISSSPAVADGIVYIGANFSLDALDATSGQLIWRALDRTVDSAPTVVNGVVYVGTAGIGGIRDVRFFALNAKTGTQLWNCSFADDVFNSPAVYDGMVYVNIGDTDGYLHALNAKNGVELWNYSVGSGGLPAVAYGMVYAGIPDSAFYALNAATGKSIWNFTTPADAPPIPGCLMQEALQRSRTAWSTLVQLTVTCTL